ncbi:hypothetical protein DIPPA_22034 [Diplonema papillatum]|nr:hypothetical protein DIPPA_22034 [Diplonema papillatum]|eukprot:gene12569-19467_t
MTSNRWVEDELRGIDNDFRQEKMNAFGSVEDTIAEHVEELVTFTGSLLLANSRNAVLANGQKPKADEEFLSTDMTEANFEEVATDFRNKQKHIEATTALMTNLAAKVSTINDCVMNCDMDDE